MGYVEDLRKIVGHLPLILVGAVVVIADEVGRILLQKRTYPKGVWGIPGGLMELGESTEEVAQREVFEETNLKVSDLELLNVYSGHKNLVIAENGDQFYVVTVAYYTHNFKGKLKIDKEESLSIEFFQPEELPKNLIQSHKVILNNYFANNKK